MEKILISACLYGQAVRYDAGHCLLDDPTLSQWRKEGRLVEICPEMAGGLPTPRPPCEIDEKTGRIMDEQGTDNSAAFVKGAQLALDLVKAQGIKYALLKENSPSCGVNFIYDGSFRSTKKVGSGITASVLKDHGVLVFSECDLDELKSRMGVE